MTNRHNDEEFPVRVQNVTKIYEQKKSKVVALDNISLDFRKGSITAILGHNGAGKSTLARIITGLSLPTFGLVLVNGTKVADHGPEIKSKIGCVTQDFCLDSFATVYDTLRLYSLYYGKTKNDSTIDELLNVLDLADRKHKQNFTLSLGMKRRLMMAKALVHDPEIIILDEPTVGVDFDVRNKIISHVQELKKRGKTIILITHHLDEVEKLADDVAILQKGILIYKNTKSALEDSFRTSEIEVYLDTNSNVNNAGFFDKIKNEIPFIKVDSTSNNTFITVPNKHPEVGNAIKMILNEGFNMLKIAEKTTSLESAIQSVSGIEKKKE